MIQRLGQPTALTFSMKMSMLSSSNLWTVGKGSRCVVKHIRVKFGICGSELQIPPLSSWTVSRGYLMQVVVTFPRSIKERGEKSGSESEKRKCHN